MFSTAKCRPRSGNKNSTTSLPRTRQGSVFRRIFFYDNSKITKDLKGAVNSKLQIRPEYYRKVDELLPLSRYNVLHVRCSDENGIDLPRIVQSTRMLQLPKNTVVLSSDFNTKKKLQEMFGFHMCETRPAHTAYSTNVAELESVLIDYIILSRSASTY